MCSVCHTPTHTHTNTYTEEQLALKVFHLKFLKGSRSCGMGDVRNDGDVHEEQGMGVVSGRGSYAKGLSIGIATHFSHTEVDRECGRWGPVPWRSGAQLYATEFLLYSFQWHLPLSQKPPKCPLRPSTERSAKVRGAAYIDYY